MLTFPTSQIAVIHALILVSALLFGFNSASASDITTSHGFSVHGALKYPANFSHFDFANPAAPKGGTLVLSGFGTFDSLNPYTLKGISPFNSPGMFMYGFGELNETLLIGTGDYSPSADEPQSAYGLLAASLRYPADYAWVEFSLRDSAHFHDGHPVDAQDVVFSYQTLTAQGHPRFQIQLGNVASVQALDTRTVRVTFKQPGQASSILRFGEMPVLPEHFWRDKDFASSSQIKPLLSGPYEIGQVENGSHIEFIRKADFWGKDLNAYQGRYNFDQVRIDFYRDQTIAFEAFKAGAVDMFYDYTAKNWASAYDFPAVRDGRVIKEEIRHQIPSGTQGFFFNTRRDLFSDVRVREALSLLFDFEWSNQTLFNGAYRRSQSYYPNSRFGNSGPITPEELALLAPYQDLLPAGLFTQPFTLPVNTEASSMRKNTKQALALLSAAGWELEQGILKQKASGQLFKFEIMMRQAGLERVLQPYIKNLEKVGINAEIRLVDTTQYKNRLDQFDFDMTTHVLSQGLSPSVEQKDYFHSSMASVPGSLNISGIQHPVVDAMLERVLAATTETELSSAMKALDRVLLWQHYIVPNWYLDYHRIAWWNRYARPEQASPFKLGIENWWSTQVSTTPSLVETTIQYQ